MDSEKLLNILDDLKSEEAHDIAADLNQLRDFFKKSLQGNDKNVGKNIEDKYSVIKTKCEESEINELSISNQKIINKINAENYFGIGIINFLSSLLHENQYNTPNVIAKLNEYIKSRNEFIVTITQTIDNLKKLNIEPYYFIDEIYQVGVLIPCKNNLTTIPNIEKQLHNWNFVLRNLAEITKNETADIKVSRVSSGSIELFFNNAVEIADGIGTIISKIGVIYLTINEIRKHRAALKELKAPTGEQKAIEKHEKEILDNEIENAANDIIKKYDSKIEKERKNELKNGLNKSIKFIAKTIDKGIEVEIITPYISEPDDIVETDNEEQKKNKEEKLKEFSKKQEQANLIRKSGNTLKEITGVGQGILKMLTEGDERIENE